MKQFEMISNNVIRNRFDVERWFKEKTDTVPVNIYGQREDDLGKQDSINEHVSFRLSFVLGWIYTVTVKTQAVLPAQKNLHGKIFLTISGENDSLTDTILSATKSTQQTFHAGGEDVIELKSSQRLGEVNVIC